MPSDYDATEFVDGDFQAHKSSYAGSPAATLRAPTREEVDSKVAEAHQRLAEKKRELEELERERAGLEETRRRQMEFQTGREEMLHHLTRGVGLLEEAEFKARQDAEQMNKTLVDFRDALAKVETIRQETWTKDGFHGDLTKALTTLENARMEWNSARLKFPVLSGKFEEEGNEVEGKMDGLALARQSFGQLCRLGFALTWPVALVVLIAAGVFAALLLRR